MANWFYGVEGQSNGPVDDNELRAMLASGMIHRRTQVWREGMETWRALEETPEWSTQIVSAAGQQMHAPGVVPNHGYAVASLCCGIGALVLTFSCGIGFLAAVPGAIFGHLALREIRNHPLPMGGRGMAIAGLVMSYLAIALVVAAAIVFAVVVSRDTAGSMP